MCRCTTRCRPPPPARAAGSWLIGPNTLGMSRAGPWSARLHRTELLHARPPRGDRAQRHAHARHRAAADPRPASARSMAVHIGGDTVAGRNPQYYICGARTSLRHRRRALSAARSAATRNMPWPRPRAASPSRSSPCWSAAMRPRRSAWTHAGAHLGSAREGADAKLAALAAAGCRVAAGAGAGGDDAEGSRVGPGPIDLIFILSCIRPEMYLV